MARFRTQNLAPSDGQDGSLAPTLVDVANVGSWVPLSVLPVMAHLLVVAACGLARKQTF